jgi:hypothetical protein
VAGSHASGLFVAAAVPLGLLTDADLPVSYSLTVYDVALNASNIASGDFTQLGQAASGLPAPFADVTVGRRRSWARRS